MEGEKRTEAKKPGLVWKQRGRLKGNSMELDGTGLYGITIGPKKKRPERMVH